MDEFQNQKNELAKVVEQAKNLYALVSNLEYFCHRVLINHPEFNSWEDFDWSPRVKKIIKTFLYHQAEERLVLYNKDYSSSEHKAITTPRFCSLKELSDIITVKKLENQKNCGSYSILSIKDMFERYGLKLVGIESFKYLKE